MLLYLQRRDWMRDFGQAFWPSYFLPTRDHGNTYGWLKSQIKLLLIDQEWERNRNFLRYFVVSLTSYRVIILIIYRLFLRKEPIWKQVWNYDVTVCGGMAHGQQNSINIEGSRTWELAISTNHEGLNLQLLP